MADVKNSDAGSVLRGAVGLVRTAPKRMNTVEPFFMEFIAGVESVLNPLGISVMLAVTDSVEAEIATYRRWAEQSTVGAVLVTNLMVDDPRSAVLEALGLRAVLVGEPAQDSFFPSVFASDTYAMNLVVEHLAGLGHSRIAHITGPQRFRHTATRSRVLAQLAGEYSLEITEFEGDYSDTVGESLTKKAMQGSGRPTAMIYDNDVMAVAGLHALHSLGIDVPSQVAVVAWDDSPLCRLTQPPLTTATLDVFDMGANAARVLLDDAAGVVQDGAVEMRAKLIVRGSSV